MRHSENFAGILYMLGASLCFAVMAAATKLVSGRIPAAQIICVRSVASSLVLAVWVLRTPGAWPGRHPVILSLRGIVGFIALFFYFWALPQIDLGTAVMLNYTAPIFAVLASLILGHEKISNSVKSIIAVAFAGVYLLISPHWDIKPAPMLAGLLSGCLAGIVHVLIRQTPKEEKPLMIIFYFTVSSTVGSCLMLGHFPWVGPTMKEWFWLALVTVSSFGGQVLLTHSLKSAPVSVVSPFGYITPVLGMLIGWLIWKESPTAMSLVGSAVVIGCGFLLYRKHS